jgi:pilus assembly protein CpaF
VPDLVASARALLDPSDRAAERQIRERVVDALSRALGDGRLLTPSAQDEARVRAVIDEEVAGYERRAVTTNGPLLVDAEAVQRRLFDSVFGLGILQPLMDDPRVEEIIVNGPLRIFTIRDGRKEQVHGVYFETDDELRQLVKRVVSSAGRRLDEASPMVDVRLRDGSRLNAVIPPAATRWTSVTIRKFVLRAQSLLELVELGALPAAAAEFLDAAVQAGVNMLVSGQTGSGKTTLLNALGASIAALDERVVTVEEVPELLLDRQLPDCVALQMRGKNVEGVGEISIRDLVRNALRMRPTRIVVGEVRGAEALDMLMAMNTGHDGSLTTIHGNSPRDALDRLASLAMMAGERLAGEELVRMVSRTIERSAPGCEHLRSNWSRERRHQRPRDMGPGTGSAGVEGSAAALSGQDGGARHRVRPAAGSGRRGPGVTLLARHVTLRVTLFARHVTLRVTPPSDNASMKEVAP